MWPETLAPGDAFLLVAQTVSKHLWVVVSNPVADPERVVLVNLTSHRADKEDTCILMPGDHPFIAHKTVICYERARATSLSKLVEVHRENQIVRQQPFSDDVLARIRDGLFRSIYAPKELKTILIEQGFKPPS